MSYDPIPACNLNPLLDALVISTLNIQFFQLTCQVRSLLLLIPSPIRAFIAVLDKKTKKKERYSLGIFLNNSWYSNFKTPNVTQPFRNSEKIHRNIFFLKPSGWFCLVVSDTRGKKGQIRAFNTCSVHFEAPQHKHAHGYVTPFVKAQREETDWLRGSSLTHCETLAL